MAHAHSAHARPSADETALGERNREHFDKVSVTAFETPWVAQLCEQVSAELRDAFSWMGVRSNRPDGQTRMLDYACGDGTASRALAPLVGTVRGIDISDGMVQQYNLHAEAAGFARDKMHAVRGNVLADGDAAPGLRGFDVAVVSLALHHVADAAALVRRLADRLAPGGVLVVADWVDPAASGCAPAADAAAVCARAGFREHHLRRVFAAAGLGGWRWRPFAERSRVPPELGGEQLAFLARGVKAP